MDGLWNEKHLEIRLESLPIFFAANFWVKRRSRFYRRNPSFGNAATPMTSTSQPTTATTSQPTSFSKVWANAGLFFVYFFNKKYCSNCNDTNWKKVEGGLGIQTRATGWEAQMKPRSFGAISLNQTPLHSFKAPSINGGYEQKTLLHEYNCTS